jgi:hypothetical protein
MVSLEVSSQSRGLLTANMIPLWKIEAHWKAGTSKGRHRNSCVLPRRRISPCTFGRRAGTSDRWQRSACVHSRRCRRRCTDGSSRFRSDRFDSSQGCSLPRAGDERTRSRRRRNGREGVFRFQADVDSSQDCSLALLRHDGARTGDRARIRGWRRLERSLPIPWLPSPRKPSRTHQAESQWRKDTPPRHLALPERSFPIPRPPSPRKPSRIYQAESP